MIVFVPAMAYAQQGSDLSNLMDAFLSILNTLSYVAIGLAFLFFVWGLVVFIVSDIPADKKEGRQRMFWGVIALFVLTSIFGIVRFLQSDIFANPDAPIFEDSQPTV